MTTSIIDTIEGLKAAAKPGMYILTNDFLEGSIDVILWETEADSENDDGANAIGRWFVSDTHIIRDGVVDANTFG